MIGQARTAVEALCQDFLKTRDLCLVAGTATIFLFIVLILFTVRNF